MCDCVCTYACVLTRVCTLVLRVCVCVLTKRVMCTQGHAKGIVITCTNHVLFTVVYKPNQ